MTNLFGPGVGACYVSVIPGRPSDSGEDAVAHVPEDDCDAAYDAWAEEGESE
jgi:hypothetical protein